MSDMVVDSSVVAKWVLPEPDSAHAKWLIAEVALKGQSRPHCSFRVRETDYGAPKISNEAVKRWGRTLSGNSELSHLRSALLLYSDRRNLSRWGFAFTKLSISFIRKPCSVRGFIAGVRWQRTVG
jgi:hypothetical protein